MSRIKIKNFGPVKSGFLGDDGFIDIAKVTVFIGNQGAGKSTVTKLISVMTWMEKTLVRGDLKETEITRYNRFVKKYCGYQNIQNYFTADTEICYQGSAYSFSYKEGRLEVLKNLDNGYQVPKIMYIPAERNFVSAVDKPSLLKNLPSALYTFLDEFENAKQELSPQIDLPVGNVKFEYQKLNKMASIVGQGYKIRLSEASSGYQSFVPLFLVTKYLSESIGDEGDASKKGLSIDEEKRIKKEIENILSNDDLSQEVKNVSLKVLSSKFKNSCFINIVEEPEQNLYPGSQKDVFYKLLEFVNKNKKNSLIVTTHSPYIISYLTLAMKGFSVLQKIDGSVDPAHLLKKLDLIVSRGACVNGKDVMIYEIDESGRIGKLESYADLPSDDNFLNNLLAESNFMFDELLSIEEQCQ